MSGAFQKFDQHLKHFTYFLWLSGIHLKSPPMWQWTVRVMLWMAVLVVFMDLVAQQSGFGIFVFDVAIFLDQMWLCFAWEKMRLFLKTQVWKDLMKVVIRYQARSFGRAMKILGWIGCVGFPIAYAGALYMLVGALVYTPNMHWVYQTYCIVNIVVMFPCVASAMMIFFLLFIITECHRADIRHLVVDVKHMFDAMSPFSLQGKQSHTAIISPKVTTPGFHRHSSTQVLGKNGSPRTSAKITGAVATTPRTRARQSAAVRGSLSGVPSIRTGDFLKNHCEVNSRILTASEFMGTMLSLQITASLYTVVVLIVLMVRVSNGQISEEKADFFRILRYVWYIGVAALAFCFAIMPIRIMRGWHDAKSALFFMPNLQKADLSFFRATSKLFEDGSGYYTWGFVLTGTTVFAIAGGFSIGLLVLFDRFLPF